MKLTPTSLQRRSADKLLDYQHGLLWADPGTGKTLTSLLVAEELRDAGDISKILVVCPKIAVTMWEEIFLTQWGEKAQSFRKTNGVTWNKMGKSGEPGIIITTFGIAAAKAPLEKLRNWVDGFTLVIIDESHYCKSHDAKRAQALLEPPVRSGKVKLPNGEVVEGQLGRSMQLPGVATQANYILQLTGTPITRYPDDLWMQLAYVRKDVLAAHRVETYNMFAERFCTFKTVQYGGRRRQRVVAGSKNEDQLRRLLDDCKVVRMSLEEAAAELPPLTYSTVDLEIPKKVEKIKVGDDVLLREINNADSPYAKRFHEIGVEKAKKVVPFLMEHQLGPVLIGTWHKAASKALYEALKDQGTAEVVDGSTSNTERDRIAKAFNAGEIDWLIGQMKAMGVSWNLQSACRNVVVVEQVPSPGDLDQFVARVQRKGQTNHVQVFEMLADDDLDIALRRIRASKRATTERILE